MRKSEIRPGIRRLFRLVSHRRYADDADEEIRLHLRLRTDQLIREGMPPDLARIEAERRFGPVDEERERFQSVARRRDRRVHVREWMASVAQDIRFAIRTLRRESGFTVFAVLIIGLGIGASATVFSLVNGVLLRPMPFRDPSHLVWISNIADDGVGEWRLQVDHYLDLGRRNQSLDGLAGYFAYYGVGDAILQHSNERIRLTRVPVTCNFVPFLGVKLLVGRSFLDDECRYGAAPTVLLTESLWRQRFAADPSIVGRSVTIDDAPATIIGVLSASFDFASVFAPGTTVDFLSPFPLTPENNQRGNTLATIGRLKPSVSIDRARAELVPLGKQLSDEFPRRNTIRPKVLPLDQRINGRVKPALTLLAGAVVAVMLIVCANLSSLQFARMSSRQRELAVRLTLGAGRARLVRQTLTESLVLAGAGAFLGLALGVIGTRAMSRLSAFDIPLLSRVRVDPVAIGIASLVAVATGVLVGMLPALHAPADVHDALSDGRRGATRGRRHARVRAVLVVTEIAAACVLLVASGLLIRSFIHVLDVDLGYRPEHSASLRVDPAKEFADQASQTAYYDDVLRRARAIPGVTGAGLSDKLPFGGDRSWGVAGVGQMYPRGQMPEGFVRVVSSGYFATMGISIRTGRDFTDADDPASGPVVIVNEALAKTLWPGRDAVGQFIRAYGGQRQVVGVVGNVRHDALERAFTNEVYYPMRQFPDFRAVNLVVRTSPPLTQLGAAARGTLEPIAPDVAKNQWRPLQSLIDKAASPRRFVVFLLGGFAAFSLLLAALGIYALISYGVTQRTQEIGIRLALGASTSNVRTSIMRGTLWLSASGMLIGIASAALLVPTLNGMLFGVGWTDPTSFAGALLLLAIVAISAGYFPARRAARVDPSIALRES